MLYLLVFSLSFVCILASFSAFILVLKKPSLFESFSTCKNKSIGLRYGLNNNVLIYQMI